MNAMDVVRNSVNFREYTTVDRSKWTRPELAEGEPDKAQWIDAETGLDCLIVRNRGGALCGYVGVDPSHPKHGRGYSDLDDIDVHGGLTFADKCAESADESKFICHVPAPGRPDHVWWFGFDCAHSGDISPAYDRDFIWGYDTYRDMHYVIREVQSLARQLSALSPSPQAQERTE